ncbi:Rieske domain-containing protein isoform X2 [Nematostella vectensis]|uniref:Rieske domain-containing protein isoform X2 n=1 Tax=Nematostella vectensis TaxID=45351 RepID=UPI00207782D2|nr:Rieske domain-containing protein isoform X2 [Nematostella vectensis]
MADENALEFVFIGKKQEIAQRRKVKCSVMGRVIAVFFVNDGFHALDHYCYRGPLSLGDIEEVEGKACIICPYHKYKIVLETGEGLYYSFNPKDFSKPPKLCSKGVKQRTHHVRVSGNDVYVALSDTSQSRDSDYYSSDAFKATKKNILK